MSESPMCPQCGQWMTPTDLHEDGSDSRIIGACWRCPCGFQDPRYLPGVWEELEARTREEERRAAARFIEEMTCYTLRVEHRVFGRFKTLDAAKNRLSEYRGRFCSISESREDLGPEYDRTVWRGIA